MVLYDNVTIRSQQAFDFLDQESEVCDSKGLLLRWSTLATGIEKCKLNEKFARISNPGDIPQTPAVLNLSDLSLAHLPAILPVNMQFLNISNVERASLP